MHPTMNTSLPQDEKSSKRFRLIAYIRVDPEDADPLTYEEALAEKEQQELMCPENIFQIEEIKEEWESCTSPLK